MTKINKLAQLLKKIFFVSRIYIYYINLYIFTPKNNKVGPIIDLETIILQ